MPAVVERECAQVVLAGRQCPRRTWPTRTECIQFRFYYTYIDTFLSVEIDKTVNKIGYLL